MTWFHPLGSPSPPNEESSLIPARQWAFCRDCNEWPNSDFCPISTNTFSIEDQARAMEKAVLALVIIAKILQKMKSKNKKKRAGEFKQL